MGGISVLLMIPLYIFYMLTENPAEIIDFLTEAVREIIGFFM